MRRLQLRAYCTSKRTSTQATPFFIVYEAEAMIPLEVMVHLAHLALPIKVSNLLGRIYDIEAHEQKRQTDGRSIKDKSIGLR